MNWTYYESVRFGPNGANGMHAATSNGDHYGAFPALVYYPDGSQIWSKSSDIDVATFWTEAEAPATRPVPS